MSVENAYGGGSESGEWAVFVSRNLNDWKLEVSKVLLNILSAVHVNTNRDQPLWKLKENDELTVKSFYNHLHGEGETSLNYFPARQI